MMVYRWFWWSLLAVCLAMALAAVLITRWLGTQRPSAKARLVRLQGEAPRAS